MLTLVTAVTRLVSDSDMPPAEVRAALNTHHLSEWKHVTKPRCFIKRQEGQNQNKD